MTDPTPTPDAPVPAPAAVDARALGRQLLDAFAVGWSKASVEKIMAVFAKDAVFVETPFSEPRTGWDQIRSYWADVPFHQSEISVTMGEVFVVGPWFATEFRSVFRRRRTGEWVEAKGALFCESAGDKITEMRMYWHRR
ncbi:MAG: nuclear transport factor 2 family protein [Gemmatimonadales bacterium]